MVMHHCKLRFWTIESGQSASTCLRCLMSMTTPTADAKKTMVCLAQAACMSAPEIHIPGIAHARDDSRDATRPRLRPCSLPMTGCSFPPGIAVRFDINTGHLEATAQADSGLYLARQPL
eukprot:1128709-Rhodomonas_salina.2